MYQRRAQFKEAWSSDGKQQSFLKLHRLQNDKKLPTRKDQKPLRLQQSSQNELREWKEIDTKIATSNFASLVCPSPF